MVFLGAVCVLMWLVIGLCLRALFRSQSELDRRRASLSILMLLIPTILISLPIVIEFYKISQFINGNGVTTGQPYLPMSLIGSGGIILLAAFLHRLARQRKQSAIGFLSVGATVIGLAIAGYMTFVATDQFLFYVPNSANAGVLNWQYFSEMAPDVVCESPILLVKDVDQKIATYRCPAPLQMVLGRYSGAPFVAWPSFREGQSEALAIALRKVSADAYKLENEQSGPKDSK